MRREEFDELTPAEIGALTAAWRERQQREDYRAGVLASLIANAHRDPKRTRKPFKPEDFFPALAGAAVGRRPKGRRMTNSEIIAACRLMVGRPPRPAPASAPEPM